MPSAARELLLAYAAQARVPVQLKPAPLTLPPWQTNLCADRLGLLLPNLSLRCGRARLLAAARLPGFLRTDRRGRRCGRWARLFLSGAAFSRCPCREECALTRDRRWWGLRFLRRAWLR